jgi:hypothetical protein
MWIQGQAKCGLSLNIVRGRPGRYSISKRGSLDNVLPWGSNVDKYVDKLGIDRTSDLLTVAWPAHRYRGLQGSMGSIDPQSWSRQTDALISACRAKRGSSLLYVMVEETRNESALRIQNGSNR